MSDLFTGMEVDIRQDMSPIPRARGTLLSAARLISPETLTRGGTNRLGAGIAWKPYGELGLLDGDVVRCDTVYDKQPGELPDNVTAHPFALWNSLECSTLSDYLDELVERVNFNMDLLRSATFARELENARITSGPSLASTAELVSSDAASLLSAIVALENFFAGQQSGAQATLHLTPGLLVRALGEGIVEWRDGQYRTATDTVVVGDSGFQGSNAPEEFEDDTPEGTSWIYISGDIWYADIAKSRPVATDDNAGEFVLTRNLDRPLSEMWGLITFDPALVGAALVSNAAGEAGGGGGGDASAANQEITIENLESLDMNTDDIEAKLDDLLLLTDAISLALGGETPILPVIEDHLATLIAAPSNATSAALANTGVISNAAATLFGISGYADAAGFVVIHNKASAPSNTDVPVLAIPVEAGKAWSVDFGIRGRAFDTGISIGFSATGATFTSGGGSHTTYDAQYA